MLHINQLMKLYLFETYVVLTSLKKSFGERLKEQEYRYETISVILDEDQSNGWFFERVLMVEKLNKFPLTNRLRREFIELSPLRIELPSIEGWIKLPPYYNPNTKLFYILFDVYCKSRYQHFLTNVVGTGSVNHEISQLNVHIRKVLKSCSNVTLKSRDEIYINHLVKLSIFNFYLYIQKVCPNNTAFAKITLEELLYFMDPCYHENKNCDGTLAYKIKNYLLDQDYIENASHCAENYKAENLARLDAEDCNFCPTKKQLLALTQPNREITRPRKITLMADSELCDQHKAKKILNVSDNTLLNFSKKGELQKMIVGRNNFYVLEEVQALRLKRRRHLMSA